jgi:hypothetical protein
VRRRWPLVTESNELQTARCPAVPPRGRKSTPHPEHLQEQEQGENRVKSMLFHMLSGEGALLITCSKRFSPLGADVLVL